MRTNLDHLPSQQQRELSRVVEILHAEFADALALGTSGWKRQARILKMVLFGSYARGGWVDEPHTAKGYQSDFDILIIVSHEKLTDVAQYWSTAEDRIIREPTIKRPVNFIVHTMDEVNRALSEGQYFYSDLIQEGVQLYNLNGTKAFRRPVPLSDEAAYNVAKRHFESKFPLAENALRLHIDSIGYDELRDAAFLLHQAAERLYSCYLLVRTNYTPSSHNIKFLRSLCESQDSRLIEAWPRDQKLDKARFELLKRAYVEARYSEHFAISTDDLEWQANRVGHLKAIVETICQERLDKHERAGSG